MAHGQTTNSETLYKVMLSYFVTRNMAETARQLQMPESTVKTLIKANIDKPEFVELRRQKKEEFIEKADEVIFKTINRIIKTLDEEDKIPLSQLATTFGIIYDKKALEKIDPALNKTPTLNVNIVDNSNLEKVMYEEDE